MSRFILLFKEIAIENFRLLLLSIMMVLVIAQFTQAQSQWGDILKGAKKSLGVGEGLSDSKMVDGLRVQGIKEAVEEREDPERAVEFIGIPVFGRVS